MLVTSHRVWLRRGALCAMCLAMTLAYAKDEETKRTVSAAAANAAGQASGEASAGATRKVEADAKSESPSDGTNQPEAADKKASKGDSKPAETGKVELPKASTDSKPADKKDPASSSDRTEERTESAKTPRALPATGGPASEVTFSFEDADWDDVFKWLAQKTGKALRMDKKPEGKFNYFDTKRYTISEAIDVINTVLMDRKFAVLMRENFLMVVSLETGGFPSYLVEEVGIKDLAKRGRTEPVKVLVPLEGMSAEEAKKEFEQIKSPFGNVYALPSTNQLLVVDIARNAQAIVELIERLTSDGGSAVLRAFPLKHVSALDAEGTVREMLGITPRDASGSSTGSRSTDPRSAIREMMMRRMGSSGGGDRDRDRSRSGGFDPSMMFGGPGGPPGGGPPGGFPFGGGSDSRSSSSSSSARGPFVSVDERTNTLFVTATPDKLALVADVVKALDVPDPNAEDASRRQTPLFQVYPVESGTASGLVTALDSLFERSPETRIAAHPSDRALMVYATPREHERIGNILKEFEAEGLKVEVIQLRFLDPVATATLIKSLLGQPTDEDQNVPFFLRFNRSQNQQDKTGPSIEADTNRQQLVVRGTQEQIAMVRDLLGKMGEQVGSGSQFGSRHRVIPLGQHDPVEVLERLQRIWPQINQQQNPIQVDVVPGTRRSEPKVEEKEEPAPSRKQTSNPRAKGTSQTLRATSVPTFDARSAYRFVSGEQEPEQESRSADPQPAQKAKGEPAIPENSTEKASKAKPGEPVHVVIDADGNLSLFSNDTEALDLMENLLASLSGRGQASQSGFDIYYLKAADAEEMATVLDQLLYGQRSVFSANQQANATTEARIMADTRTNALLVIGPPSEHRKIQELLVDLDRDDPPATGVAAQPRTIELRYASATKVAEVVRETFAPILYTDNRQGQNPQQQQQQFGGPFPFFGGGGSSSGRGRNSRTSSGKATVSVDQVSNSLIVSAPKPIFDQIEELAMTLDDAARDNRSDARIVPLKNANPETVQKALGTLFSVKTGEAAKKAAPGDAQNKDAKTGDQNRDNQGQQGPQGMQPPGGFDRFRGGSSNRGGDSPFRRR